MTRADLFGAVLFAAAAAFGAASQALPDVTLTVQVSGAQPGKGQAICSLFDSPANYLRQPIRSRSEPIDTNGEVVFRFDRLPAGTYAVSVVYDEDGNGELNTGFLGIPTELIGMSNQAKGMFGPPSFEQAAFALHSSRAIDIVLDRAAR